MDSKHDEMHSGDALASKKMLTDENEKDANNTWYINKGQAFITLTSFRNIASHQIGNII